MQGKPFGALQLQDRFAYREISEAYSSISATHSLIKKQDKTKQTSELMVSHRSSLEVVPKIKLLGKTRRGKKKIQDNEAGAGVLAA